MRPPLPGSPARPALFVLTALIFLANFLSAGTAHALDIDRAKSDGAQVRSALSVGESGDWEGAQAMVASNDQVVRDIVLWRKLRNGAGSVAEYNDYLSRRASWPGRTQLDRVVLGRSPSRGPGLSGQAAENRAALRSLMKKRNYEEAEDMLARLSASPANLGDPGVWSGDRLSLARHAARTGRAQLAYDIASKHYLTQADGYDYSDCEWVAGWVALTKLKDPARAITHFQRFHQSVETPISLGRGGYWLGRAYEAAGQQAEARRWYAEGAQHQTSFYGQLAAQKIGAAPDQQIAQGGLPEWRTHPAMRSDDVRAAVILYFAGEDALAMAVFSDLGETLPPGALAPLGRLVLDLGQPHYAVRIAKKAARRGVILHPAYYPLHEVGTYATKVEPAFALSIARQETELNPRAISRAGARGLMQLMPGTAQKVAGWIGEDYSASRLLDDWRYNVRLGETYLSRRTEQYGGSYVMAAAAYNAGYSRVDRWIGEHGDPRLGQIDMIDWMEQIPFNETRNYVQRVMEGLFVYRSRLAGRAGTITIEQDLRRGFR